MESLKSSNNYQTPLQKGVLQDSNAPFLYNNEVDQRYSNYIRQSGLEVFGKAVGNTIANTALEAIGAVGTYGEFAIRSGILDKMVRDEDDFQNSITQWADKNKNPFGEIAQRGEDTFDLTSGAWWANVAQSTLPTVLEFAAEASLTGGVALGAASKFAKFLNLAKSGEILAGKAAQGLTAFALTKHESYMMAAQSYNAIMNDYMQKFEKGNPTATQQQKLQAMNEAKKAASEGANFVDSIYTTIALPFQLTGIASIFRGNEDDVYKFFKEGVNGRGLTREAYKQQLEGLGLDNPYIQKMLAKKSSFNRALIYEAAQEGFEEVEGEFAQQAGEALGKDGKQNNLKDGIKQFENFFKYTLNDKAALSFFTGAFMGGAQTMVLENAPVHRVNQLDSNLNAVVDYIDGKPVIKTELVNSRTRDAYGKAQQFTNIKDALIADIDKIDGLVKRLEKADYFDREEIKRELFAINAYDSIYKGLGENLINSIREIGDTNNSKNIVEDLQAQLVELESIEPESKEDANLLTQKRNELTKQIADNQDTTLAMQQGLAKSKEDNDYKRRADEAISEIKQLAKFHEDNKSRFGTESEQSTKLAEYVTRLQGEVLGRERIGRDFQKDIETEIANYKIFGSPEEIQKVQEALAIENYKSDIEEVETIDKALEKFKKGEKDILEPLANKVDKSVSNEGELAKALQELRDKKIKESNEKLSSLITSSQSYSSFLGEQEDSEERQRDFIKNFKANETDLDDIVQLNKKLYTYNQDTQAIRNRLADVISSEGREKYVKDALKSLADLKQGIERNIETFTYSQAKRENMKRFYINKLRNLNNEQVEKVNKQINKIKKVINKLRTEKQDTSTIRNWYTSLIKNFTKVQTNEQRIERLENYISDLEKWIDNQRDKQIELEEQIEEATTIEEHDEVISLAEEVAEEEVIENPVVVNEVVEPETPYDPVEDEIQPFKGDVQEDSLFEDLLVPEQEEVQEDSSLLSRDVEIVLEPQQVAEINALKALSLGIQNNIKDIKSLLDTNRFDNQVDEIFLNAQKTFETSKPQDLNVYEIVALAMNNGTSLNKEKQYEIARLTSQIYYDMSDVVLYKSKVDLFNEDLADLKRSAENLSLSRDITPQEETVEEQEPILNLNKSKLNEVEDKRKRSSIASNLDVDSIEYYSLGEDFNKGQVKLLPKHINNHTKEFLNEGDTIVLKKLGEQEARQLAASEPRNFLEGRNYSPESMVVEIRKSSGELIGYVPETVGKLIPNDARSEETEKKNIANNNLIALRKSLFELEDGKQVETVVTSKGGGWHIYNPEGSTLLSENKLLDNPNISLLIATTGKNSPVQLLNGDRVINEEEIANYNLFKDTLDNAALFLSYPSALRNKNNIIPTFISNIKKDLSILIPIFREIASPTNSTLFRDIKDELGYDLKTNKGIEGFLNQYYLYTSGSKRYPNTANAITVYPDGDVGLRVNSKHYSLKKNTENFLKALSDNADNFYKHIVIANDAKGSRFGINNSSRMIYIDQINNGQVSFKQGTYNEYISSYVSTNLYNGEVNKVGDETIYVTKPKYKYDLNRVLEQVKESKTEVKQVEEEKPKSARGRVKRSYNAIPNSITSLDTANKLLSDKTDIVNLNKIYFDNFPVLSRTGVNQDVYTIYTKQFETSELNRNVINLFNKIRNSQLKDRFSIYKDLSKVTTKEEFGALLKRICL